MECSIKKLLLPVLLTGSLSVFLLFGSTEIEGEGQHISQSAASGKGKIQTGQTFFSHYENLNRIDVMFSSSEEDSQKVTFYLKEFAHPLELCEPVQQQIKTGFRMYDLYQGRTIGQTFISRCPDLKAIRVLISIPQLPHKGKIVFRLKSSKEAGSDIVKIIKDVSHIKNNEYNSFEFTPLHDSQGKSYYFLLEVEEISSEYALKIPYTPDETYKEGRGYMGDTPITGDVVFKKSYRSLLEEKETLLQMDTMIPKIQREYRSFRFPPIQHSRGKYYYFFIEFQGNTLAPWEVEPDLYQHGSKIVNHSPVRGDLTFRVLYKSKAMKTFHLLLERISKDRPGLFSRRFFYVLVFLLYLLFFTLFLWQLMPQNSG